MYRQKVMIAQRTRSCVRGRLGWSKAMSSCYSAYDLKAKDGKNLFHNKSQYSTSLVRKSSEQFAAEEDKTIRSLKCDDGIKNKDVAHKSREVPSAKYYSDPSPRGRERVKAEIRGLKAGDFISGFSVDQVLPVPVYDLFVIKLTHATTGAEYIHVDSDDTNNVFSVIFRTPPNDSSGAPHILEHSVLCGSQLFPVRDPFFNMLKRSLNTYMNAMTAADHTLYPFSTTNEKDFANLLAVYLDAVFFPLLDKLDFQQEGHRLEFSNPADPASAVVHKGIVYNEMKGTLSDVNTYFGMRLQQHLFPGSNYSFVSGGLPQHIPELTWETLREYHRLYYHPSNALFYTFGDLPLERHLSYLNTEVLSRFNHDTRSSEVAISCDLNDNLRSSFVREDGPVDAMGQDLPNQLRICKSFITNDARDTYNTLVMRVVSSLLLSGPSAPFYRNLIEAGLGNDFVTGTGYDASTVHATFVVGVQGISENETSEVLSKITSTLHDAATHGFEDRRVKAILHQVELGQRHIQGNFGINLLQTISTTWTHRGNPLEGLKVDELMTRLKSDLNDTNFLKISVQNLLLECQRNLTFMMTPKENFSNDLDEAERMRLAATARSLTEKDKNQILESVTQLKAKQDAPPDIGCLPTLSVKDIPRQAERTEILFETIGGATTEQPFQWVSQQTNGVVYLRMLVNASEVQSDLRPYLPLFSSLWTQLGAGSLNHYDRGTEMEMVCGGISASSMVYAPIHHVNAPEHHILCTTYCLQRNFQATLSLLTDLWLTPHWSNREHMLNLIQQAAIAASESIAHNGNSYAQCLASASLTPVHQFKEMHEGLSQVQFLQRLASACQDPAYLDDIMQKMVIISQLLLHQHGVSFSVVGEEENREFVKKTLGHFLRALPESSGKGLGVSQLLQPAPQEYLRKYVPLPLQVNFVSQCLPSVAYLHDDSPALTVLAQIMSSCYLHREVREKGGAYGVTAAQSDGIFSMTSYYDPHIMETLDAFHRGLEWAGDAPFTARDIEEAKLSIFGDIDSPSPPSSKGYAEFLYGITPLIRQQRRDAMFAVDRGSLIDVAQRYFDAPAISSIAVLGRDEGYQKLGKLGWETVNVSTA